MALGTIDGRSFAVGRKLSEGPGWPGAQLASLRNCVNHNMDSPGFRMSQVVETYTIFSAVKLETNLTQTGGEDIALQIAAGKHLVPLPWSAAQARPKPRLLEKAVRDRRDHRMAVRIIQEQSSFCEQVLKLLDPTMVAVYDYLVDCCLDHNGIQQGHNLFQVALERMCDILECPV
ncbi:uncharacterized protein BCR38DRAFT_407173 [Pseudomassariella vexata]|uniref:Uncharacterized protein n=1 Tax=Pseudomassariella vexata TaxID=1141098 RepID=A0A1Y2E6V3_9PEZI|nr:uncharacterized protein BCR38DRAFT_407173 [Pseudomassariella vexata]ORY67167.1 hypothetical protein BCR38DRAFT_407173 [Pseudomassariella vexata]